MITSVEVLVHFQCDGCQKWWCIGDAPLHRKEWFCPWCGKHGEPKDNTPLEAKQSLEAAHELLKDLAAQTKTTFR